MGTLLLFSTISFLLSCKNIFLSLSSSYLFLASPNLDKLNLSGKLTQILSELMWKKVVKSLPTIRLQRTTKGLDICGCKYQLETRNAAWVTVSLNLYIPNNNP